MISSLFLYRFDKSALNSINDMILFLLEEIVHKNMQNNKNTRWRDSNIPTRLPKSFIVIFISKILGEFPEILF